MCNLGSSNWYSFKVNEPIHWIKNWGKWLAAVVQETMLPFQGYYFILVSQILWCICHRRLSCDMLHIAELPVHRYPCYCKQNISVFWVELWYPPIERHFIKAASNDYFRYGLDYWLFVVMPMSVGWSTTLVQAEISQQLLDGLPWHFA